MAAASEYLSDFRPRSRQPSAADLCVPVPCMTADETNEKVMEVFARHRDLHGLPVVEDGRPIGLINRNSFLSQMSKPFRMELFGRKSCIAFMDKEPLVVDESLDIDALTFLAVEFGEKALADGFIVTRGHAFAGVGSGLQLMRAVADMQAARNRQIMLSIEYASVIQQAMLRPSRDLLARACPDADLVWEPRDVVGGDFFHACGTPDGWFVALADCTGHGVPGAFMTLIASASLGQAVERHGPRDPGGLLAHVNRGIKQALGQMNDRDETPGSDDGLDAACLWVQPAEGTLVFAGARLSLFVRRPGGTEVELVEGHRRGVGYVDSPLDEVWPNHTLHLPSGSLVFVTTDGLIDQIGGPRAIALGKRRLRELLLAQPETASPTAINRAVGAALHDWQGAHHRRDDLTFFCFRV